MPCYRYKNPNAQQQHHRDVNAISSSSSFTPQNPNYDNNDTCRNISFLNGSSKFGFSTSFLTSYEREQQQKMKLQQQTSLDENNNLITPEQQELLTLRKRIEKLNENGNDNTKSRNNDMEWIYGGK